MIRTRLAQTAAVAALAIGTVVLTPTTAPAAQAAASVSAPVTVSAPAVGTATPANLTWGS